jgi:hypothetical protein
VRARSQAGITVEQLEPRFLLSGAAVGPSTPNTPQVITVGRVVDGTGSDSQTTSGTFGSADSSATYQIAPSVRPDLVTLWVLTPQTQATWSLVVRDSAGRELGSATVPPGQPEVNIEISAPLRARGGSGPISLTVAAQSSLPGESAGSYILDVETLNPATPASLSFTLPTADDLDSLYLGPYLDTDALTEPAAPSHHRAATQGSSPVASDPLSQAPPAGSSELPQAYVRPTLRAFGGTAAGEEPVPDGQTEVAATDRRDVDQERLALAVQELVPEQENPAGLHRQLVDAPGGLPGMSPDSAASAALARRMAEQGRPHGAAAQSGPVVVSATLAAGLIVPNVLILGGPRIRRSRPLWRWGTQRRPASA